MKTSLPGDSAGQQACVKQKPQTFSTKNNAPTGHLVTQWICVFSSVWMEQTQECPFWSPTSFPAAIFKTVFSHPLAFRSQNTIFWALLLIDNHHELPHSSEGWWTGVPVANVPIETDLWDCNSSWCVLGFLHALKIRTISLFAIFNGKSPWWNLGLL